jgi:hypothetical protein
LSIKLFNVAFDYTEQASIPYIAADTPEAAIEAAKILTTRSKMNSPTNFQATETKVEEDASEDYADVTTTIQ